MVLSPSVFARALYFALALLFLAPSAQAQRNDAAGPLAITLTLKRVQVGTDAKETLADAATVKPGDLVEYRAVYTNTSGQPLTGVLATLPLPEGFEYEGQTAVPTPVMASTDGTNFRPTPLTRTVVKDGKQVVEQVPLADYRALRWPVGVLAPGREFEVKARARVSRVTATPVAGTAAGTK